MVAFCSTVQTSHRLFCVGSLDCQQISELELVIASQEKENMILCIQLMKKWEPIHLTVVNSKSEEGQGDYQDKTENI